MPEIPLQEPPFSPRLGWSSTRSEVFRSCLRRYFLQYYARHETELDPAQLQRLRSLSSIPMTVGNVVHELLATLLRRLLRSAAPIDGERFRRHVERSVAEWLARTELMEVYYGQRPAPLPQELIEPVLGCLERFLASGRFATLRDGLAADPPFLIEPPGYGEARLQGMKIYARVDCLLELGGETVILDWKTGRQQPERHRRQLRAYAAWAEDSLGVPAGRIRCVAAYLQPGYLEVEERPSRAELQELAADVAAEIGRMEALCRDPQRNRPLPRACFPCTEDTEACRHCPFREPCGRLDPQDTKRP